MLEHVSMELQNLPTDANAAIKFTTDVDRTIKEAHIQALKH